MKSIILLLVSFFTFDGLSQLLESSAPKYIIGVPVQNKMDRSRIANLGFAIEEIRPGHVYVYGGVKDLYKLHEAGFKPKYDKVSDHRFFNMDDSFSKYRYREYPEIVNKMLDLASKHSFVSVKEIGKSVEGRPILVWRISNKSESEAETLNTPAILITGCHHAREHLSVEVPTLFAEHLISNYGKDENITRLVDNREIFIAPIINPDGHIHDRSKPGFRMWRKNRRNNGRGVYGVDLNRNYGFQWGTGGSSKNPSSDVYMGPKPFSEPESQAVKNFATRYSKRMTVLTSFHSFSELILYPWGHTYDSIGEKLGDPLDLEIHKKMAKTMSRWNGYKPQQSSDLYIASGDTTDWSYGALGMISFTFELSPKSMWSGGFYPGTKAIEPTFQANIKPLLYLIEYSKDPSRVLKEATPNFRSTPARNQIRAASFEDLGF